MSTNRSTLILVAGTLLAVAGVAQSQAPASKPAAAASTQARPAAATPAASSTGASTNPPAPSNQAPARIDFSSVDKDSNGQLSREEAVAVTELESAFDTLDANQDKAVTPLEYAKWRLAGNTTPVPRNPATAPGGSAGAQHMPKTN